MQSVYIGLLCFVVICCYCTTLVSSSVVWPLHVESAGPCGDPSQMPIGYFSRNLTLPAGLWMFRPTGGFAEIQRDASGSSSYVWAVRITPGNCGIFCSGGNPAFCASGLATSVLGSPQAFNTSAAALEAVIGQQLVLRSCGRHVPLMIWFQDTTCDDNTGGMDLEAIPLRLDKEH